MKIEMGKKYRFDSGDGTFYGSAFRRVLAIDVEGLFPVAVELEGWTIVPLTLDGKYWTDKDKTFFYMLAGANLIEVKENEE